MNAGWRAAAAACAVITLLIYIAWLFRYQVVAADGAPPRAYQLDRWTGKVRIVANEAWDWQ